MVVLLRLKAGALLVSQSPTPDKSLPMMSLIRIPAQDSYPRRSLMARRLHIHKSRCDRFHSDGFKSRLMLSPVVCLRGPDAAQFLYDDYRFTRVAAMPTTVIKLLQDFRSVQMLEDGRHQVRKAMFLQLASGAA